MFHWAKYPQVPCKEEFICSRLVVKRKMAEAIRIFEAGKPILGDSIHLL